nr:sigma-70 family RNA polymerase sigma factor [Actinospica durhamensis]
MHEVGQAPRDRQPSGYAQTVLVNSFISMRRKKSSGEQPSERVDNAESAVSPTTADADVDLRMVLIDALRSLPRVDRAVLVLRFWEDRSVEDTAGILKLNANTVRSRSFRALSRLRELLGANYADFMHH